MNNYSEYFRINNHKNKLDKRKKILWNTFCIVNPING